jgi:sugar phosphate isomerase/epimerase
MPLKRSQFALNPIHWHHTPEAWPHRKDGDFLTARQPGIYAAVADSGFGTVMLEVVEGQELEDYQRVVADHGLRVAPGIVAVPFPDDIDAPPPLGAARRDWFDGVRRLAEASHRFGLESAFLCPSFRLEGARVAERAAVGHAFDPRRLDQAIEFVAEAARVLAEEGIRAGLHNHVGTWIETEAEIDHAMAMTDPGLLGAGFDVGHLAWAGIDSAAIIERHRDRLLDLHVKDLDLSIAERTRHKPGPYLDVYDEDFFREPGRGDVDLDAVVAALGDDYDGWIVIEVDRTGLDPAASARESWAWVERVAEA